MSSQIVFHEPGFVQLAILGSFLVFLQVGRNVANYLGAGLLGEIAVGVIYGPVARTLLPREWEETLLVIGYIGLILLVFEGGLTISPAHFVPSLPLALVVGLTGILLPIAFTFAIFIPAGWGTPLETFAVGAALASTSLGTTFFVLRAQGTDLQRTRIGSTLVGAALIDDVIALVLLSVLVSVTGDGDNGNLGWTIGRPLVASIALACLSPPISYFVLRPIYRSLLERRVQISGPGPPLWLGVAILHAYLAIAYYAGMTMLLGAFLAGVTIYLLPSGPSPFLASWETSMLPIQHYIFSPIFFASIGFTIPFLDLWDGRTVWRGIIFSILMTLGKLLAGSPIFLVDRFFGSTQARKSVTAESEKVGSLPSASTPQEKVHHTCSAHIIPVTTDWRDSIPPALFLGTALVARGEIGLLILQVALPSTSESYKIGVWAVAVCTIVGPLAFKVVIKRWGTRIAQGSWGE